jgi:sulfite reductase (ferredoxin)
MGFFIEVYAMKVSNSLWKEKLAGQVPENLEREVDIFDSEIALRKQGKIDERVFAETRLRRGTYGQRYDNGQRYDGTKVQPIVYPSGDLTKGPVTMWDAPGMQRIKIPGGGMNAEQLETMAELAEEYSDGIGHVTTRQDFQLHYIHIEDTPALMRRLAAVGITTREACGNSVRNVTACPYAGVCGDEVFDVTPYSHALAKFLMGHPDCQNFGRKFKPAFSGCAQHACGLTNLHAHRERPGEARIFRVRRRGTWRGSLPGEAVRFVRAGGGNATAHAGDCAGVRAAGREEESQPGAHQISGA